MLTNAKPSRISARTDSASTPWGRTGVSATKGINWTIPDCTAWVSLSHCVISCAINETDLLDINECLHNLSHCQYNCQNTEGSFICSCPYGFLLNPDGLTCRDLDECATGQHICQQKCINTEGSYKCGCEEGYSQIGDRCQGKNKNICFCYDYER